MDEARHGQESRSRHILRPSAQKRFGIASGRGGGLGRGGQPGRSRTTLPAEADDLLD